MLNTRGSDPENCNFFMFSNVRYSDGYFCYIIISSISLFFGTEALVTSVSPPCYCFIEFLFLRTL